MRGYKYFTAKEEWGATDTDAIAGVHGGREELITEMEEKVLSRSPCAHIHSQSGSGGSWALGLRVWGGLGAAPEGALVLLAAPGQAPCDTNPVYGRFDGCCGEGLRAPCSPGNSSAMCSLHRCLQSKHQLQSSYRYPNSGSATQTANRPRCWFDHTALVLVTISGGKGAGHHAAALKQSSPSTPLSPGWQQTVP